MASEKTHKAARRTPHTVAGLCCYVCGGPVKDLHTDYATTIKTEPLTVRHNACAPGTSKWMASEHAERSEIRQFFITDGEESAIMETKTIKAFPKKDPELTPEQRQLVGRVKYMAYMTTVLKAGRIDWTVAGDQTKVSVACVAGRVAIMDAGGKVVLDNIPEQNASEELRSFFLNRHDEERRKKEKTAPVREEVKKPMAAKPKVAAKKAKPAKKAKKAKPAKKATGVPSYVPTAEGEGEE